MNETMRMRVLTTLPVIYLFLTIFPLRNAVGNFYALSGVLLLSTFFLARGRKYDAHKLLGITLVVFASIGLSAATILTIEKIELLKDPKHVTSCSVSPVISCSPVIASPQASAFDHIPNPIFGIFGFGAVLTAGMTLIAGARKLARPWWLTLMAGVVFGTVFSIWLIHEGVYEIGALCLYCMSVWMVTFSLFWFVLSHIIAQKQLSLNTTLNTFIVKNRDNLIAGTIGVIVLLLYFRWSDYWNSLF